MLIEVLSVTEEYAFARCECRRLETSEDVHQHYEPCVVYFGQDQLKKLKFGFVFMKPLLRIIIFPLHHSSFEISFSYQKREIS